MGLRLRETGRGAQRGFGKGGSCLEHLKRGLASAVSRILPGIPRGVKTGVSGWQHKIPSLCPGVSAPSPSIPLPEFLSLVPLGHVQRCLQSRSLSGHTDSNFPSPAAFPFIPLPHPSKRSSRGIHLRSASKTKELQIFPLVNENNPLVPVAGDGRHRPRAPGGHSRPRSRLISGWSHTNLLQMDTKHKMSPRSKEGRPNLIPPVHPEGREWAREQHFQGCDDRQGDLNALQGLGNAAG